MFPAGAIPLQKGRRADISLVIGKGGSFPFCSCCERSERAIQRKKEKDEWSALALIEGRQLERAERRLLRPVNFKTGLRKVAV